MQSHFNFWNFTANETSFFMAEPNPALIRDTNDEINRNSWGKFQFTAIYCN